MARLVLFQLFVTNVLMFEHQQNNCSLAQFSGPCVVTKFGSG